MNVANVVDRAAHGIQQRRAATGEILLLRHGRHLFQRQAVVDDHALVVKQHGGDQRLARFLFLLGYHGVESASSPAMEPLRSRIKTNSVIMKTLLRLITRLL